MANNYDHSRSIKRRELSQPFVFWLPQLDTSALPPELPQAPLYPLLGLHPNERDRVLISTTYHESMWAAVIGIQASRFAVSGWSLDGGRPRIQSLFQEILLNSTVGIVRGWTTFASAGMASMCNTGKWFIEIERWTSNRQSRVKALHHLDPSRCWITTDPERPVLYIDKNGGVHELKAHQVIILMDAPELTEYAINSPQSPAAKAYNSIVQLAAINQYLYEKVSGRRPLQVNFIQGLSPTTLQDVMEQADNQANQRGIVAYMGSVMAGVMGDTPLNLVSIPLAEIPDSFNATDIRRDCHLTYANALGDDPAGIDPALIGNRQLGAGTQATVLDDRASRGGITNVLKQLFTHRMVDLLRDEKIQFAFTEKDLRDQRMAAEVGKLRADTRAVQVATGEMSAAQATNVAVDAGDLPPEFLIKDETESVEITDDENPEVARDAQEEAREAEEPEEPEGMEENDEEDQDVPAEAMKMITTPAETLLRQTSPAARRAMERAKRKNGR